MDDSNPTLTDALADFENRHVDSSNCY